jgi:hypothetical protein
MKTSLFQCQVEDLKFSKTKKIEQEIIYLYIVFALSLKNKEEEAKPTPRENFY